MAKKSLHARTLNLFERIERMKLELHGSDWRAVSIGAREKRRFERWKTAVAGGDDDSFRRRLLHAGIPVQRAEELVSAPEGSEGQIHAPEERWLSDWTNAAAPSRTSPQGDADTSKQQGRPGFFAFVEPFIGEAHAKLLDALQYLDLTKVSGLSAETCVGWAMPPLTQELMEIVSRILVLELNVQRVQERLNGETAEERFSAFSKMLEDPTYRAELCAEYAVAMRAVARIVRQWEQYWIELVARLVEDIDQIAGLLSQERNSLVISAIRTGAGDRHRDGRSVAFIQFACGDAVVYKPRSLGVDIFYTRSLESILTELGDDSYHHLRHCDRHTHGWSTFAKHQPCENHEELRLYYRRLGVQLALLYAFDATDMHLENIIASGSHPHVVDLEALFHPRQDPADQDSRSAQTSDSLGWRAYHRSVMRVGLLPSMTSIDGSGEMVELSGMGGTAGQLTPDAQPVFGDVGKDTMSITRKRLTLPGGQNQPKLKGSETDPRAFALDIDSGFEAAYRRIAERAATEAGIDGLLAGADALSVRAVLRHTRTYAVLLRDSYHPDFMRDAIDRSIHFEWLWRSRTDRPGHAEVIEAEILDLENGDVPLFTSAPNSTSVWTSTGKEIRNYFSGASLSHVRRKLGLFSREDLDRQRWFVRASLASLDRSPSVSRGGEAVAHARASSTFASEQASASELAQRLGFHLSRIAYEEASSVTWLGLNLVNERYWALQPVGEDLYNGRLGIALFLLELSHSCSDRDARRIAEKVLADRAAQMRSALERGLDGGKSVHEANLGAFGPLCGSALVLARGARLLGREDWLSLAVESMVSVSDYVVNDQSLDIISGSAGYALACLDLFAAVGEPRLVECAHFAARHLQASATHTDHGCGWFTRIDAHKPLTGFSHGASGIALALLKVGECTGDSLLTELAHSAVEYERTSRLALRSNWPDYRTISGEVNQLPTPSMVAWCHGAPGIGVSRHLMLQSSLDGSFKELVTADLEHAVETTVANGFHGNHSLCHGALGNHALLEAVRDHPSLARFESDRIRSAEQILVSIRRLGPVCGIPNGVETPGLMTGMAGIGLGLLRLQGLSSIDPLSVRIASHV